MTSTFKVLVGLATKAGLLGTTILAAVAAFGPVLDVIAPHDSKQYATLATILLGVTIFGRMLQQVAGILVEFLGPKVNSGVTTHTLLDGKQIHPLLKGQQSDEPPVRDAGDADHVDRQV